MGTRGFIGWKLNGQSTYVYQQFDSYLVHPQGRTFGDGNLPADFDFDAFAVECELVLNVQGEAAARERWPNLGMAGGVSGRGADEWRRVSWRVSHRQQAGEDWWAWLNELAERTKRDGLAPAEVRLCFFFDS